MPYPEFSWAIVRAAPPEKGSAKSKRQTIRVHVSAVGPRQPETVKVFAFEGVRRGAQMSFSDVNVPEATTSSPGVLEFKCDELDRKRPLMLSVDALGFLPGGLVVDSCGVEVEFILVPELPTK